MADVLDVVIVGGDIAGSSLAYALASAGRSVTVLESSVEYEDRVRGESMLPWGVKEARNLGVEQILLDAGAHVAPAWLQYLEAADEPALLPVSMMIEGIPGALNMRHPDACQALIDAAAAAGATVVRGVHDVQLSPGQPVSVTYSSDRISRASSGMMWPCRGGVLPPHEPDRRPMALQHPVQLSPDRRSASR